MSYMEQLLKDWYDYCEGRKDFDTGDFYALFHDDISDGHIKAALSFFPHAEKLFERVKKVRKVIFQNSKPIDVEAGHLISLAQSDLQEKRKICEAEGATEVVTAIDNAKPRFVDASIDLISLKSPGMHSEYRSILSEYLDDRWVSHEAKYYALFEAFYGLTNTYEIAWYLGALLIDTDINLDHYFDLWSAGGDYALTETELLVTLRG